MGCGMYYIGVDLGTSSVKLILMEPTGDIVNTVSKTFQSQAGQSKIRQTGMIRPVRESKSL